LHKGFHGLEYIRLEALLSGRARVPNCTPLAVDELKQIVNTNFLPIFEKLVFTRP
jgi:hypothetical protein